MSAAPRLLVVSHPCVAAANQSVYADLLDHGWDVRLVVPARWRDAYRPDGFAPTFLPPLADRAETVPVLLAGQAQRHVHRAAPGRLLDRLRPDVVFVEQEPFAMVTGQWLPALRRRRLPFGLQHAENLDRRMPAIARVIRTASLARATFVWARSPAAAALAVRHHPGVAATVVPHAVPGWETPAARATRGDRPFTVGYAGRLVAEKGVEELVTAVAGLEDARLLAVGAGPLADRVRELGDRAELREGVGHAEMDRVYADMDVLVLPSRTTTDWAEQFGRVLVEALWCGCPVVGSSSGEIPWVVETTGGGWTFPEGDATALRTVLATVRDAPEEAARRAAAGRAVVAERFSSSAVAAQMDRELRAVLATR